MTHLRLGLFLVVLCLALAGCTLMKVQNEHRQTLEATAIAGHIRGEFQEENGPLIVAARTTATTGKITNYTVVHGAGEYEMPVHHGTYVIFAFQDQNRNLQYDAGEPAGQHGDPTQGSKIAIPPGTKISALPAEKLYSRQAGVIVDLEDERFCEENGREYYATMIAMAAKPQQKYISFSVEKNKTKDLHFVFEPDGELYGCVTTALKTEDKFAGRPDNTYQAEDEAIQIHSVRLTGKKMQRTLYARKPSPRDAYVLIERKDYCTRTCFGFFGLPAGKYSVLIKAHGYQAVKQEYSIVPGHPKRFRETEL